MLWTAASSADDAASPRIGSWTLGTGVSGADLEFDDDLIGEGRRLRRQPAAGARARRRFPLGSLGWGSYELADAFNLRPVL